MAYAPRENELESIRSHFGRPFALRVLDRLEKYASAWRLDAFAWIDSCSVNCVFACRSERYGDAILKICQPGKEVMTEIHTLQAHGGAPYCKLFAFDADDAVILEERIVPGTPLRAVQSMEIRLNVFLSLYARMHIRPENPAVFPTYAQWVDRISAYMDSRQDYPELCGYMREANALCRALCERYESPMLLHGDFHHDNILLVSDGQYRIIDPKGVVGDPLFDIPRFLLNECRDECSQAENRRRVSALVDALCARLNLPAKDLRTAFFIEMAMAHCWSVESNEEPNMEDVVMAYEIMRAS